MRSAAMKQRSVISFDNMAHTAGSPPLLGWASWMYIYIYKYKKRMLQISKLVTVGYLMIYSCIFIFDDDYSYSFEQ